MAQRLQELQQQRQALQQEQQQQQQQQSAGRPRKRVQLVPADDEEVFAGTAAPSRWAAGSLGYAAPAQLAALLPPSIRLCLCSSSALKSLCMHAGRSLRQSGWLPGQLRGTLPSRPS
jgi:type II secretory pathway pseudopilin PulG